ncbi:collagen-like repeat preface domain-containing protein [Priestia megaterium]|uniref:collagen-like repeat preface domain-containing protein n=1 Tax=Priestia megaterium TaxID=1404 RepID=UPI001D179482|nr:collagen-like repeat preface domain-containing protein [Priestia megaterium]
MDCIDIKSSQIKRLLAILDNLKKEIPLILKNPTSKNINTIFNSLNCLIVLLNELKPDSSIADHLIITVQNLLSSLTTRLVSPVKLLETLINSLKILITLLCLNSETHILFFKVLVQVEVILAHCPSAGPTGATGLTGDTEISFTTNSMFAGNTTGSTITVLLGGSSIPLPSN